MAKKIGDVVIALIILSFIVSGFTMMVTEFDDATDSSTLLTTEFTNFNNNLSEVSDMNSQLTQKIDNQSTYVSEADTDVNTLGNEGGGILNLLSKNILVKFINQSSQKLGIPTEISLFVILLITAMITILFMRLVASEGRV